jgi:hypothetical protein
MEPRSNARAPPSGRSTLAPTGRHVPALGSSSPCGVAWRVSVGASRLRPTTKPAAAEAAATEVPMTTWRRRGAHRESGGCASAISEASLRCRSVTNSSRGASLPNRAARSSMAVFICSASKSSGRARSVGCPPSRRSTKRRTVRSLTMRPPRPIVPPCAARGTATPLRWQR